MRIKKKIISNFLIPMRENVLIFCMQPWTVLGIIFKKYRLLNRKSDPNWRVNNCWTFALILLGCSLGPLWSHVGSIRYDDQKKK